MTYHAGVKKIIGAPKYGPDTYVVPYHMLPYKPKEWAVYAIIHWLWINKRPCATNAVIGYISGLSERSVTDALTQLKKKGDISVLYRRGRYIKPAKVLRKYTGGTLPKCYYCPETDVSILEGDHHIAKSKGGTEMVLACSRCNSAKGSLSPEEFQQILEGARPFTVHG